MPRTTKKKGKTSSSSSGFSLFDDGEVADAESDEDLPKDEAGRSKIKQQYVELLGIRIHKLKGRILNRERINKTLEGVYFICARCEHVCHNLDEGLVEDEDNERNLCIPCSKIAQQPVKAPTKAARSTKATKATRARK
jgi:hypothetical protein